MKNRILPTLAATIFALAPALAAAENGIPFHWAQGQRAAVSLAYDDALDSQLDVALPQLEKYGLKGSFYLQLSNPAVERRLPEWRAAARNGHELGNHSLFHQCSRKAPGHDWVPPQRDLDTTSVAQMQDQLALANSMLYAIDGQRARTYTVPCGDTLASGGDYLATSAAAHEELLSYLAAHRQLYWTDTFLNIMTYVKTHRGDH